MKQLLQLIIEKAGSKKHLLRLLDRVILLAMLIACNFSEEFIIAFMITTTIF